MLVDGIRVEAFRGIRDALDIDFTAPLTLLYAPNGTGKTTLCDALEWLLTGRVERLKGGVEDVRCRLVPDEVPSVVEATLRAGGATFQVRRTRLGSETHLELCGLGVDDFRPFETALLLEVVTGPTGSAGQGRRPRSETRPAWIRATRLLSGPTLDLLLDSAEESSEQALAFSELFGVAGLQKQEQVLDSVLNALGPAVVNAELERTEGQSGDSMSDFEGVPLNQAEYLRIQAGAHLAEAAKSLNVPDAFDDLDEALRELRMGCASKSAALARRDDALWHAQREWPQYTYRRQRTAELAAEVAVMERRREKLREECARLATELEGTRSERDALSREMAELSRQKAEVEDELAQLQQAFRELRKHHLQPARVLDVRGGGLHALRRAARVLDDAETQRVTLQLCIRNLPEWRKASSRLEELQSEMDLLSHQQGGPLEEAELPGRISANAEDLALLRARKFGLLNPLDHVRDAARALLEMQADIADCPVCGHPHGSAAALDAAITTTLQAPPALVSELDQRIDALAEEADRLNDRQQRWIAVRERRNELDQAMRYPRTTLAGARSQLDTAGLRATDLADPDLERELSRRLRAQKITIKGARAAMDRARVAHLMTQRFHNAGTRLARQRRAQDRTAPAEHPGSPEAWLEHLSRLGHELGARLENAQIRLADAGSAAWSLQEQHGAAAAALANLEGALGEAGRRLNDVQEQIRAFEDAWAILAGETPPDEAALRQAARTVADERESVTGVQARLDEAEHLLQVASTTAGEDEARRLHREQQASRRRLEIVKEHCDSIRDAISILAEQRRRHVKEQLRSLGDSMTALYLRAQANRVFDEIGGIDGRWRAVAGDKVFDRMAELSQGQRQNYALAIFLARARGLRGSFFLDEPLAHLDDVNRVAILDMLRVLLAERSGDALRLIVTTSDFGLVRHFGEKLSRIQLDDPAVVLRTYRLSGNPRSGVRPDVEVVNSFTEPSSAFAASTLPL